jgi:hypothetical protein
MNLFRVFGPVLLALWVGACAIQDGSGSPGDWLASVVIRASPITVSLTATVAHTATPTLQPSATPTTTPSPIASPTTTQSSTPSPTSRPSPTPTADPNPLSLPDLYTLPPSNLTIETHHSPQQRLLRLSNSIANSGPGTLELWGESDPSTGKTIVTQRIYTSDGAFVDLVAGEFFFHPQHDHWHLMNFARYELWTLSPSGWLEGVVGLTDKVSYCLRDNFRVRSLQPTTGPAYLLCYHEMQGISAGWVDRYQSTLPGQVIDITGLPSHGFYALRSIVDPEDQLLEANEANNDVLVYIEIDENQARIIDRVEIPIEPSSQNPPRE